MSPSWGERIIIMLSPQQVTLVRWSRGLRPAVRERKTLECATGGTGPHWQPALDVLRPWLTQPGLQAADAYIVLSNHFVRYLLVPWNPDLVTPQEELAFVRSRFLQVFGDAAEHWMLKLSRPKPEVSGVACAIERPFLDALNAAIANSPLTLRAIQPGLMAAFNGRRRVPRADAWLVVAEPGHLLLGLLRAGEWHSLRARSLNGQAAVLADILEQERMLVGIESAEEQVYLHRTGNALLDVSGLKIESWLPGALAQPMGGLS